MRTKLSSLHELQTQVEQSIQEVKALEAEWAKVQAQTQQQASDVASDDTEPGVEEERRRGEIAAQLQAAYTKLTEQSKAEKACVPLSTDAMACQADTLCGL